MVVSLTGQVAASSITLQYIVRNFHVVEICDFDTCWIWLVSTVEITHTCRVVPVVGLLCWIHSCSGVCFFQTCCGRISPDNISCFVVKIFHCLLIWPWVVWGEYYQIFVWYGFVDTFNQFWKPDVVIFHPLYTVLCTCSKYVGWNWPCPNARTRTVNDVGQCQTMALKLGRSFPFILWLEIFSINLPRKTGISLQ